MMRLLPWLLVASCAGRPAAPSTAAPGSSPPRPVVEQIRGVLETYRQAYEVRSIEALAALYQTGLDVVVVHQGHSYRGSTAVRAYLNDLLDRSTEVRVEIDDVAIVALSAEIAAVTAKVNRSVGDGVAAVEESGVLSLVFRRPGQTWLIVSEHFSYPPRRGS